MQVASSQAARALTVLRGRRPQPGGARRRRRRRARPAAAVPPHTIARALATIEGMPPVRAGRVEGAAGRPGGDRPPSAEAVAEMLVRRTVCDRLR